MSGARRHGRPHTAWMDNIKTWTGLPVVRMADNRYKWRKYVHGVATLGSSKFVLAIREVLIEDSRYLHVPCLQPLWRRRVLRPPNSLSKVAEWLARLTAV